MANIKKPFIGIIGSRNAGKSTIIRCLTGAQSAQFRGRVIDNSMGKEIEVIGSSPQENRLTLAQLRQLLRKAYLSASCNGVVCAIQPTFPRMRLSLEQILQEALAQGFSVYSYVLDPEYNGSNGDVAAVRSRTKAVGVRSYVLDGRRFGHINAEIINRRTRIAA